MTKLALVRVILIMLLAMGLLQVDEGVISNTDSSIITSPFSETQIAQTSNGNIAANGNLTLGVYWKWASPRNTEYIKSKSTYPHFQRLFGVCS